MKIGGKILGPLVGGTIAVLLIVIGLFHKSLWDLFTTSELSENTFGHVAQIEGNAQLARTNSTKWQKIQIKQSLVQGDRLITGSASSALINGPSGWAFAVPENSQIILEKRGSTPPWVIHIISGKIRALQIGSKGAVGLLQDGYWLDPSATLSSPLTLKNSDSETSNSGTISTANVLNILLTQKNQLQRCYAEWLQRHTQDPGTVTLSFMLHSSGIAEGVELLGPFTDRQFQSCLEEAVVRLRFPRFKGDAILFNIPLQFKQTEN